MTPFESGSLTFAAAAGAMAMKFSASAILRRWGFRRVLIFNGVLSALFLFAYGLITAQTPHWLLLAGLLAGGYFRSLEFTALNAIGYADIDQAHMSRATSLASVSQQMSSAVGVAVAAASVESMQWLFGDEKLVARDMATSFAVVAMVTLSSVSIFARLKPDAGAEVSGAQVPEGSSRHRRRGMTRGLLKLAASALLLFRYSAGVGHDFGSHRPSSLLRSRPSAARARRTLRAARSSNGALRASAPGSPQVPNRSTPAPN